MFCISNRETKTAPKNTTDYRDQRVQNNKQVSFLIRRYSKHLSNGRILCNIIELIIRTDRCTSISSRSMYIDVDHFRHFTVSTLLNEDLNPRWRIPSTCPTFV